MGSDRISEAEFERLKQEMRAHVRNLLPGIALDEANVVATFKDGSRMTVKLGPITYGLDDPKTDP